MTRAPKDCAHARAILWPTDRPRLAGDDVVEAARHVEACPECARALSYDAALLAAFERVKSDPPPRAVRERVYDAIARERTGSRPAPGTSTQAPRARRPRRGPRVLALGVATAGLTIILIVTATVVVRSGGPTEVGVALEDARNAAAFIEDYMRRAVREDHITTSDPRLVREFLARELGLPIGLIRLDGFDIEGAEVCLLEGIRGAMVAYKRDGELLSYYVLPRRSGGPRAPALRTSARDDQEGGTSVVTWATREAEYALVGTLPATALLDAARNAATAP